MTDKTTPRQPFTEESLAEAIRSLPVVPANPAFYNRLKQDFISGRISRRPARIRRFRWWPGLQWIAVPAAAAVLAAAVLILNRGPGWSVVRTTGHGSMVVDGRELPQGTEALARLLGRGPSISLSEELGLVLLCRGTVLLELTPGTDATIPRPPGRFWGRDLTAELRDGGVHIMTGGSFPGHRLSVLTSEGITEIAGTIVSVDKDSLLTCVCVLEDTAWVGTSPKDLERIPAGMRKVMFGDGSKPLVTTVAPPHEEALVKFRNEYADLIRGGTR